MQPLQPDLFSGINSLEFPQYHFDNPHIYEAFKKYTFLSIGKGFKNFSAQFIFEVIRWETSVNGNDMYKINNNFRAFYSRLFMNQHPEYEGYFRTRKSKWD